LGLSQKQLYRSLFEKGWRGNDHGINNMARIVGEEEEEEEGIMTEKGTSHGRDSVDHHHVSVGLARTRRMAQTVGAVATEARGRTGSASSDNASRTSVCYASAVAIASLTVPKPTTPARVPGRPRAVTARGPS
jgi:hypothetical protein